MAASPLSIDSIVIGRSARMRAVFDFLHVVSSSDSTVLITGEPGTGKELTAALIHHASRRSSQPFTAANCALFLERLAESDVAHGGTIFLADVDDVPLTAQVTLLRLLQNRPIERPGGTRALPVTARIIAGSNRDLAQMVAERTFRDDLYYLLTVLPVRLPPLRDRREDIPLLMQHFLHRYAHERGTEAPAIPDAARKAFMRYSWPGNVRELENTCERIAQTCSCGVMRVGCLPAPILFRADEHPREAAGQADAAAQPSPISLDDRLRSLETSLIRWALRASRGNKSRAAELLQVKRSTLGDRINRCALHAEWSDAASPPAARDAMTSTEGGS